MSLNKPRGLYQEDQRAGAFQAEDSAHQRQAQWCPLVAGAKDGRRGVVRKAWKTGGQRTWGLVPAIRAVTLFLALAGVTEGF